MTIAIVNYRYFIEGGPERYLFNITEILEQHGHTVVPFSILNSRNKPTPYQKYFLDSVDDEVRYDKSKKTPGKVLKSFTRMFYSFEAKRKFARFVDDVKPDIIYIIHWHNKISPSILDEARKRGIPVVHRISDFQYVCPNALLYTGGHICESCLKGRKLDCVRQKCVLDSAIFSAIKLAAMQFHRLIGVSKKVDAFVVPSKFTIGKLVKGGLPAAKMNHIPTFFNIKEEDPEVEYDDFFLFIGRLTPSKGLDTLVEAFAGTDLKLKIIGAAPGDGYDLRLMQSLEGKKHNIEFLGHKTFDDIAPLLRRCRATVMPAEWYENFPNSVLESFGFKKAVIASDCGSLTEPVVDGITGLSFPTGDANALRAKAELLAADADLARRMGQNAYERIVTDYSPDTHYSTLINLFETLSKKQGLTLFNLEGEGKFS